MLSEIKERATGWIAWIIVIIISIPFALWGVNEYFSGGASPNVAVVNGQEVSQDTYRYAVEERRVMARRLMGSSFDPAITNTEEFRAAVLDDLILRQLLSQDSENAGFRVGDEQLAEFIRTNPRFQTDGQFDQTAYERAVQILGYTTVGFESYMRRQNVLQQMQDGLEKSSFITAQDESDLLQLARETRVFDYVSLEPERFLPEISVDAEEIQAEYEDNEEAYRTPEMIKIQYVRLSTEDLATEVEVTEGDIQRYYEDNKDLYLAPEQHVASHILITVDQDADETVAQEALSLAESLAERIQGGEDFAELAETYSQDPGSAAKGGDLGMVEAGVMVKPFEDVLFAMQEGEVSDPVKTRYGYHLIKLTELIPQQGKDLAEVREAIESDERDRMAENLFIDRAETFRNLVYEQPESLEPVVEELGLELQTSDWFARDEGTGIAESSKLRDNAFSDDVYIENLNSDTVELDINTLVAIRKLETQPASLKPLEQVHDEIVETLKQRKAREQASLRGEELLAEIKADGGWDGMLAANGMVSEQTTQVRMQANPEPSFRVNAEVFRAPRPDPDPVYGGVTLVDGSYVLFRVTSGGESGEVDDTTRDQINTSLAARRGTEYVLSYQRGLRDAADIEIFNENL